MKPLLCFDLDNTLTKSDRAHTNAYEHALNDHGLTITRKHPEKLFGKPHHEIVTILLGKHATPRLCKDVSKKHDYYLTRHYAHLVKPQPYALSTLTKLKNNYELVIVSNASHNNIIALLKGAHLPKTLFSHIIGYDEVKHSKPAPDELFKAQHLTHKKPLAMIGDSIYDIRAARKANIPGIALLTGWYSKQQLTKEQPSMILNNLRELPKCLNNLNKNNTL